MIETFIVSKLSGSIKTPDDEDCRIGNGTNGVIEQEQTKPPAAVSALHQAFAQTQVGLTCPRLLERFL